VKRKIFYLIIGISVILFVVTILLMNQKATSDWKNLKFSGEIQNVEHLKNSKGTFIMVHSVWYVISYDRKFEKSDYIGNKIKKNTGEEGIWLQNSKNSEKLTFEWSAGGVVKTESTIKELNRQTEKIK